MKFNDVKKNIKVIKEQRMIFINKFDNKYENVQKSLIQAKDDNYLNTIRIHKYLTENKKLGKVKTSLASLTLMSEPLAATLAASLILFEYINTNQIIGGLIIIIGIIFAQNTSVLKKNKKY